VGPTTIAAATPPQTGHHHGEEQGGPWQAVTSACPRRPLRAQPRRLKRRAREAKSQPRLWSIKWPGSLPSKENPRAARAPGSENFNPRKGTSVRRSPRGPFETKRVPRAPMPRTTLLISASRAGSPRSLDGSQMPGRERLDAAPHHFTDQRPEGWLAQVPRWFADARPGALSRHPAPLY
jgi:hypothetical protein